MTKAELINKMAVDAGITKVQAAKALDAVIEGIRAALKTDEKVTLVGFGSFLVSKRKARTGRNPQTGEEIAIPARRVARFTPGKSFKESIE